MLHDYACIMKIIGKTLLLNVNMFSTGHPVEGVFCLWKKNGIPKQKLKV